MTVPALPCPHFSARNDCVLAKVSITLFGPRCLRELCREDVELRAFRLFRQKPPPPTFGVPVPGVLPPVAPPVALAVVPGAAAERRTKPSGRVCEVS